MLALPVLRCSWRARPQLVERAHMAWNCSFASAMPRAVTTDRRGGCLQVQRGMGQCARHPAAVAEHTRPAAPGVEVLLPCSLSTLSETGHPIIFSRTDHTRVTRRICVGARCLLARWGPNGMWCSAPSERHAAMQGAACVPAWGACSLFHHQAKVRRLLWVWSCARWLHARRSRQLTRFDLVLLFDC